MKKSTISLTALCIPAVAWAHAHAILVGFASLTTTFFLAVFISPFLLKRLNKCIVINNKFFKIIVLIIIEIIFIFLLLFVTNAIFQFLIDPPY